MYLKISDILSLLRQKNYNAEVIISLKELSE